MARTQIKAKNTVWRVALIITFLGVASVQGQMDAKQLQHYLEKIRAETGAPGISAAVAVAGKIVLSAGVGYAELDNLTPSTGATVHNIASVSKTHAAVAVMQLVEQGKVKLDDPIQKYVRYFPEKRWPITVRNILTHTSGIRHYKRGEFGPQRVKEKMHYLEFEDAIEIWKADSLLFKPGTFWSYSSHASNLMHGIVETVTGMSFEEYMKKYVWEPAGMLSTAFDVPQRIVHNRGRGYVKDDRGVLMNPPYSDVSYKYAGGGIISSAEDLVRFGIALNAGSLLKPETLAKMYAVQVDPVMRYNRNGQPQQQSHKQAISWYIRTDAQGRSFPSHTGTVKGTRTYLLNYPEYDLVVAVIANVLPFQPVEYGNAIAQAFLPPIHAAGTNGRAR